MKENSVKCPTCLIPVEFDDFYKLYNDFYGFYEHKAIYKCPKCGWYK